MLVSVLLYLLAWLPAAGRQQPRNVFFLAPGSPIDLVVKQAANVVPTEQQYAWQQGESIAFLHFGMNTFTNREWGEGNEDPALFQPTDLDARQWIRVLKDAGFTMAILTAKHHDGFCLWPSLSTDYSVARSPWRRGEGDLVREVSEACRESGLKFGIYLSPWDRHDTSYGDAQGYNKFFRSQLRELLTGYGVISEVWFDGANGEGAGGRKQEYDWASYYAMIRELQPSAVIFGMGPDVRWVGTESGEGRETEWSVVPISLRNAPISDREHPLDALFIPGDLTAEDLGSREKLRTASVLAWYPAETDVSIRPGWFYHPDEDARVKPPEELVDIYYNSVGRNSVLLLNIPPDRRGRIADADGESLLEMRRVIDATFAVNLLAGARVRASGSQEGHPVELLADTTLDTYWAAEEGADEAVLEIEFERERTFDCLMLQEAIRVGQRIEAFRLEARTEAGWKRVASGTTVGYKRLLRFPRTAARSLRLVIAGSRTSPTLAGMGLFASPPRVSVKPDGGAFVDSTAVTLESDGRGSTIRYTLDGTRPTSSSAEYRGPITLFRDAHLAAAASTSGGSEGFLKSARFHRAAMGLQLLTQFSPRYTGGGPLALVDAERGGVDPGDRRWQGYEGADLDAVVDLGRLREVSEISAGFLQKSESWIFFPESADYAVSDDGTAFRLIAAVKNTVSPMGPGGLILPFSAKFKPVSCRYIRVHAKNIGLCPPGHPGAGKKAWIFVDEIVIVSR